MVAPGNGLHESNRGTAGFGRAGRSRDGDFSQDVVDADTDDRCRLTITAIVVTRPTSANAA